MAVHSFEDLVKHDGHDVIVMAYVNNGDIQNVAIECLDCNEVLLDFDKETKEETKTITDTQALKILQNNYDKLIEEFEQYKKESVKWSWEDVQWRAKDKGKIVIQEEAQEILEDMIRHHDAELGINWITIDCYLDKYNI